MRKLSKTVLITGCSSGLGKSTALFLKEKGWTVFATARRDEHLNELKQIGLESIYMDLNSSQSIKEAIVALLHTTNGHLTALINNAGHTLIGAVEDLTRETVRKQFETNVFGTIELTSKLVPVMRKRRYGRIVFVSSVYARFTVPFFGAYCASKHAIESFADALRQELYRSGVFVTLIEPGVFKSKGPDNAKKLFCKNIHQSRSIYSNIYDKVFDNLYKAQTKILSEKSFLFNRAIDRVLEIKRPPQRLIVPKSAMIYEFSHRFLPGSVQDYLFFLKRKYLDKTL